MRDFFFGVWFYALQRVVDFSFVGHAIWGARWRRGARRFLIFTGLNRHNKNVGVVFSMIWQLNNDILACMKTKSDFKSDVSSHIGRLPSIFMPFPSTSIFSFFARSEAIRKTNLSFFLSFFVGWRKPNGITGLSGWWRPPIAWFLKEWFAQNWWLDGLSQATLANVWRLMSSCKYYNWYYGVATMSRLLNIIGLFYKRAL